MKRADVVELFTRLRELNPKPTTELAYTTPFELLVAVVLSAQATDVGVNKATRKLYPVANTPAAILALGEDGLKAYISTIGLFNAKAKNVIALCQLLIEQHGAAPAILGSIGMLTGYCGTLMTPMAANFNLVPAALLELDDPNAVIRAQLPTAIPLLLVNLALMYWLAFR